VKTTVALCRAGEIGENEARGFAPFADRRRKMFVVRRCNALHAYWDACPHYGDTPMAWRTDAYLNAAGDRIVCASHGAEFDIETGVCVSGAALGQYLKKARVETNDSGELVLIDEPTRGEIKA
jgi:nitrite reductase/ring-hydroxylating ferredoxin subunit